MSPRSVPAVLAALVVLLGLPVLGYALAGEDRKDAPAAVAQQSPEPKAERSKAPKPAKASKASKATKAERTAHAQAMKAWTKCVRDAMSKPGPDKATPHEACPDKPVGPGRARHDKDTPPGHAGDDKPGKGPKAG